MRYSELAGRDWGEAAGWAGLAGAAAKAQGLTGFVLKIPS